jgi:hypothetical protein
MMKRPVAAPDVEAEAHGAGDVFLRERNRLDE